MGRAGGRVAGALLVPRTAAHLTHKAWPAVPVVLGLAHFYLMEVRPGPYRGQLGIRPFAYTAFAAAVAGVFAHLYF